ncbi:MAG: hypothetical protein GYB33_21495 [Gammaproteobacteria bacterium]|nr:hypothetical protein [Gammaproteobacteria bacterium]
MVYWHKVTDIITIYGAGSLLAGAAHTLVLCPRQRPLPDLEMATGCGCTSINYAGINYSGAG